MMGDPYEEADEKQRLAEEAKLITPEPAKKSRKVVVGLVVVGLLVGILILANIAHFVVGGKAEPSADAPKPTTMTKRDGDTFAHQQAGEASYMKGVDGRKKQTNADDTVLGQGTDLAADGYDEVDGVPKKTKAQDDAEHGRNNGQAPEKSEAQQRAEKAALEAAHRKQNDLDSSPVSVDFSDYFEKEKTAHALPMVTKDEIVETAQPRRHNAA